MKNKNVWFNVWIYTCIKYFSLVGLIKSLQEQDIITALLLMVSLMLSVAITLYYKYGCKVFK